MATTKSNPTNVVVVDGSNIATEGRSMPSLVQLNDAVMAFREEFPDAVVTVVVDATFGHRIDKKEAAEFDARCRPQRARRPAGRRHRARRRLRVEHRQQGRRQDPEQRLVPGVPRRLPVAVRRGPPDRWQAGAVRRVGVRRAPSREGPDQPQVAARGAHRSRRRAEAGAATGEQGSEPADARADGTAARRPSSGDRSPSRPHRRRRPARRSTTCSRSSTSSSATRSAAASTASSSRTRRTAPTSASAISVATCRCA